jgi:hypothetical protein
MYDKHGVIYLHDGILFSLKKEKDCTHATIWMNLEDIVLSEVSQSSKRQYMIPLI